MLKNGVKKKFVVRVSIDSSSWSLLDNFLEAGYNIGENSRRCKMMGGNLVGEKIGAVKEAGVVSGGGERITLGEFFGSKNLLSIYCENKEQRRAVSNAFDNFGKRWSSGSRYTEWEPKYRRGYYYRNDGLYAGRKEFAGKVYKFDDVIFSEGECVEAEVKKNEAKVDFNTHNKFKVGDRVQFKTWEEMKEEFGLTVNGDIKIKPVVFSRDMKHLCGTYATISEIDREEVELKDFTSKGDTNWVYSIDMIKSVGEKLGENFREVQRYARAGEYIKLIKEEWSFNKIGDILKVDSMLTDGYALVRVEDHPRKITEDNITWGYSFESYVVLENYKTGWSFTEDEKVILRNLSQEYKWIARNAYGDVYIYKNKPSKLAEYWTVASAMEFRCFNHLFQTIKWNDANPCEFRDYI